MKQIILACALIAATSPAYAVSGSKFTKAERAYYQLAEDCKVYETRKCDRLDELAKKAFPKKKRAK